MIQIQEQYSPQLNSQQLEMLRLFKNPMAENDYNEIKRLAVKILAQNIDSEMDKLENENGWTSLTYEQWGKEHLRTTFKK